MNAERVHTLLDQVEEASRLATHKPAGVTDRSGRNQMKKNA
jgi:hypothetical protein